VIRGRSTFVRARVNVLPAPEERNICSRRFQPAVRKQLFLLELRRSEIFSAKGGRNICACNDTSASGNLLILRSYGALDCFVLPPPVKTGGYKYRAPLERMEPACSIKRTRNPDLIACHLMFGRAQDSSSDDLAPIELCDCCPILIGSDF
jgi:hypothetical protein